MSLETMVTKLVGEAYAATTYVESEFRPMDPRRSKRLIANYHRTSWFNTETLNRAFGAYLASRSFRRGDASSTPPPEGKE